MTQEVHEQHSIVDQLFAELKRTYYAGQRPSYAQMKLIAPTLSLEDYKLLVQRFMDYMREQEVQTFKGQERQLAQAYPYMPDHVTEDLLFFEQSVFSQFARFLVQRDQGIAAAVAQDMERQRNQLMYLTSENSLLKRENHKLQVQIAALENSLSRLDESYQFECKAHQQAQIELNKLRESEEAGHLFVKLLKQHLDSPEIAGISKSLTQSTAEALISLLRKTEGDDASCERKDTAYQEQQEQFDIDAIVDSTIGKEQPAQETKQLKSEQAAKVADIQAADALFYGNPALSQSFLGSSNDTSSDLERSLPSGLNNLELGGQGTDLERETSLESESGANSNELFMESELFKYRCIKVDDLESLQPSNYASKLIDFIDKGGDVSNSSSGSFLSADILSLRNFSNTFNLESLKDKSTQEVGAGAGAVDILHAGDARGDIASDDVVSVNEVLELATDESEGAVEPVDVEDVASIVTDEDEGVESTDKDAAQLSALNDAAQRLAQMDSLQADSTSEESIKAALAAIVSNEPLVDETDIVEDEAHSMGAQALLIKRNHQSSAQTESSKPLESIDLSEQSKASGQLQHVTQLESSQVNKAILNSQGSRVNLSGANVADSATELVQQSFGLPLGNSYLKSLRSEKKDGQESLSGSQDQGLKHENSIGSLGTTSLVTPQNPHMLTAMTQSGLGVWGAMFGSLPNQLGTGAKVVDSAVKSSEEHDLTNPLEHKIDALAKLSEQLSADKDTADISSMEIEELVSAAIEHNIFSKEQEGACRRLVVKLLLLGRDAVYPQDANAQVEDILSTIPDLEQRFFAQAALAWQEGGHFSVTPTSDQGLTQAELPSAEQCQGEQGLTSPEKELEQLDVATAEQEQCEQIDSLASEADSKALAEDGVEGNEDKSNQLDYGQGVFGHEPVFSFIGNEDSVESDDKEHSSLEQSIDKDNTEPESKEEAQETAQGEILTFTMELDEDDQEAEQENAKSGESSDVKELDDSANIQSKEGDQLESELFSVDDSEDAHNKSDNLGAISADLQESLREESEEVQAEFAPHRTSEGGERVETESDVEVNSEEASIQSEEDKVAQHSPGSIFKAQVDTNGSASLSISSTPMDFAALAAILQRPNEVYVGKSAASIPTPVIPKGLQEQNSLESERQEQEQSSVSEAIGVGSLRQEPQGAVNPIDAVSGDSSLNFSSHEAVTQAQALSWLAAAGLFKDTTSSSGGSILKIEDITAVFMQPHAGQEMGAIQLAEAKSQAEISGESQKLEEVVDLAVAEKSVEATATAKVQVDVSQDTQAEVTDSSVSVATLSEVSVVGQVKNSQQADYDYQHPAKIINSVPRSLLRDEKTLVKEITSPSGDDSIAAVAEATAKLESLVPLLNESKKEAQESRDVLFNFKQEDGRETHVVGVYHEQGEQAAAELAQVAQDVLKVASELEAKSKQVQEEKSQVSIFDRFYAQVDLDKAKAEAHEYQDESQNDFVSGNMRSEDSSDTVQVMTGGESKELAESGGESIERTDNRDWADDIVQTASSEQKVSTIAVVGGGDAVNATNLVMPEGEYITPSVDSSGKVVYDPEDKVTAEVRDIFEEPEGNSEIWNGEQTKERASLNSSELVKFELVYGQVKEAYLAKERELKDITERLGGSSVVSVDPKAIYLEVFNEVEQELSSELTPKLKAALIEQAEADFFPVQAALETSHDQLAASAVTFATKEQSKKCQESKNLSASRLPSTLEPNPKASTEGVADKRYADEVTLEEEREIGSFQSEADFKRELCAFDAELEALGQHDLEKADAGQVESSQGADESAVSNGLASQEESPRASELSTDIIVLNEQEEMEHVSSKISFALEQNADKQAEEHELLSDNRGYNIDRAEDMFSLENESELSFKAQTPPQGHDYKSHIKWQTKDSVADWEDGLGKNSFTFNPYSQEGKEREEKGHIDSSLGNVEYSVQRSTSSLEALNTTTFRFDPLGRSGASFNRQGEGGAKDIQEPKAPGGSAKSGSQEHRMPIKWQVHTEQEPD